MDRPSSPLKQPIPRHYRPNLSVDALFVIVPGFIGLMFVVVIGAFVVQAVKGIAQWNDDNGQPVLTVPARVVAKRTKTSTTHHHHGDDSFHHDTTWNYYYATYEMDTGERREFRVDEGDYGLLVEGDQGDLTFQGSRYKGFSRKT